MKRAGVLVIAIAILLAGWFFVSPLFIDEAVDESFDLLLVDGQLNMDMIMSMSATKRDSMKQEIMDAAAAIVSQDAAETMPKNSPQAIAKGQFVDADAIHKGSGQSIVYVLQNGNHVVRFEDFRTTNGPALVVYLAKHPSPVRASDVTDGGFLKLGELKGNVGDQNYAVPVNTDISEYNSVVIWCELFGVLFSPAALSAI